MEPLGLIVSALAGLCAGIVGSFLKRRSSRLMRQQIEVTLPDGCQYEFDASRDKPMEMESAIRALVYSVGGESAIHHGRVRLLEDAVLPCVESLKSGLETAGIRLELKGFEKIGPIGADRGAMQQIVTGLLIQVAKYSTPGWPVHITASSGQGAVSIAFALHGTIGPQELNSMLPICSIREVGASHDATASDVSIQVAHGLALAHGGCIHICSNAGTQQSEFRLVLPEIPNSSEASTDYGLREGDRTTLYVSNLGRETGEKDLRRLFEAFGQVDSVTVIKDEYGGEPRGLGVVEMHRKADAEEAIFALNRMDVGRLKLRVSMAKPRPEGVRRDGKSRER